MPRTNFTADQWRELLEVHMTDTAIRQKIADAEADAVDENNLYLSAEDARGIKLLIPCHLCGCETKDSFGGYTHGDDCPVTKFNATERKER